VRFYARHIGSGLWDIWDGAVMSSRATDPGENEARQKAADLNVVFDHYGQRDAANRRQGEATESSRVSQMDCGR